MYEGDLERIEQPYPMQRIVHRRLPADWKGPVFVWDVDKTYLETRFSQLRGLLRIPFELAVDKRPVSGAPELLQAMRRGWPGQERNPIWFISASPPQLAGPVTARMVQDGVEFDGITFKDVPAVLRTGRVGQLREQVAFKISALVRLAEELPLGARLHLFGDDYEKDADAYVIFAELLAGRLRGFELEEALVAAGAARRYARGIATWAGPLPARDGAGGAGGGVEGIWIRLTRDPDGARIAGKPPWVRGWTTAQQAHAGLRAAGVLP